MKRRNRLLFAIATGLPLLLSGGTAAADVCQRLRADLANLPKVVVDTASARKYASAIARQNIQLRQAKSDQRRLGCSRGSIIVIGGANADACATLENVIGKMERNLETLDSKRREFAGGVSSRSTRNKLLASLETNGCNGAKVTTIAATETLRTLDDTGTLPLGTAPDGSDRLQLRSLGGNAGHGNLRTVCVRTCDGGFFPISSNASPMDFRRDQQVCAMMCPDIETELFYQSMSGGQETEQMTSTVTGRPYGQLPAAFSYRTRDLSKPGACGCNLSAYYQEMIKRDKTARGEVDDSGERDTGSVTTIKTLPQKEEIKVTLPVKAEERDYDPSKHKVRTVGPVFLPENESAIDLGRPADPDVN